MGWAFSVFLWHCIFFIFKKSKTYPRIILFCKMPYCHIRICRIPIHVSIPDRCFLYPNLLEPCSAINLYYVFGLQIKIREHTKIKEDNIALLEEERRKKEAAKVNADRRLEELRRKKQVESQCYRDDLHRLQDELDRLQKSTGTNQPAFPSANSPGTTNRSTTRAPKQPIQRPTPASNRPLQPIQKPSHRRECVVCKKEEACVILLQCAHQVLCVGCNKLHQDKGVARCPCCSAKVEERIRVFGASSN
jgi:hypothetical protein